MATGTRWWRAHRITKGALYFDPSASYRFNAPDGAYGTCYFGYTDEASFVETMLRGEPPTRLVTMTGLRARAMAEMLVTRPLRLVPVRDNYLNALGVTAEISSSLAYERSQTFARAVWAHPDQPDGLEYRCRHDNSLIAVALFDRASDALQQLATEPMDRDVARILRWQRRWKFDLAP